MEACSSSHEGVQGATPAAFRATGSATPAGFYKTLAIVIQSYYAVRRDKGTGHGIERINVKVCGELTKQIKAEAKGKG
jgi:hypothetical protein